VLADTRRTPWPTLPLKEARAGLQKWGEEIDKTLNGDVSVQAQTAAVTVGLS
jgi:hypothetical protein